MTATLLKGADFDELADRFADRTKAVRAIRVHNDRTDDLVKRIRFFMRGSTGGAESACASLIAPTRAGKTTILERFLLAFRPDPASLSDKMPIIYVQVPSGATTKTLGRETLNVLKDVAPERGDGDSKRARVVSLLRRRETSLLIYDEMQFLVEKDRGKVAYKVSEWIQNLINESRGQCAFLLVGTTRTRRLYENNGHLIGRNEFHFNLAPYARPSVDNEAEIEDWNRYRSYLAHYDDQLCQKAGFSRSNLHVPDLALRIHAASMGYPGATAKLLRAAAIHSMLNGNGQVLDMASLSKAFDEVWLNSKSVILNPFERSHPPLPEQVWRSAWEDSLD